MIAQTRGGVTHYVVADGVGDTRALADAGGAITDTFSYDAWGNAIGRTGSTLAAHTYRGERLDPNTGFYYLRARWMDPAVGRFTQLDQYPGHENDPASLHKYLYANADPANRIDPSGHSSNLIGATIAVGIAAVLAATAMLAVDHLTGTSDSSTENRRFGVWDAVAVNQYRAGANSVTTEQEVATAVVATVAAQRQGHHTIPKYMCGAHVQLLADITVGEHKLIHAGLAGIRIALAGAEQYATKTVGIGRWRNRDILMLAQTREGRTAIAEGLRTFYYYGGWWNSGLPTSIGTAFNTERPKFESGASTSLPWCSETGMP